VIENLAVVIMKPWARSELLGTDHAGMTRLVDRLEGKGLVARQPHPQDRRSIVVGLTDAGLEVVRRMRVRLGPR
jgi:DNA-binding MarR family transcriptional regulator